MQTTADLIAHNMYSSMNGELWRENIDKTFVVGGVVMDFSKALNCISHNLLIAKLSAYGFNGNAVK